MQFNISDFIDGMNKIREYIGANPILEINNQTIDIYAISSSLDGGSIFKILKENFNKYDVTADRDATGEYHIRIKLKE